MLLSVVRGPQLLGGLTLCPSIDNSCSKLLIPSNLPQHSPGILFELPWSFLSNANKTVIVF